MYKGASQRLQRRHRVIEVRADPSTYVGEDDLVRSAGNMSQRECEEERRGLLTQKARMENELLGAKAAGQLGSVQCLGQQIANTCTRLSLLKNRIKELRIEDYRSTFIDAAKEVAPKDVLEAIYDRQRELIAARQIDVLGDA